MPVNSLASEERWLVRRAQQMDEGALSELFNIYYPKIFRYGLSHLGNVQLAEDLAADVALKVVASIHTYRFKGPPFSAWVFRIARNKLIDAFRRRRGHIALNELIIPSQISAHEVFDRVVAHHDVHHALRGLSERQAQVIMLRFIHELDTATVAAVLGTSESAIKAIQHRALKSLRRIMSAESERRPESA